ncbi:hypothetical protein RRG08_039426 [Elysia crispata]|uniref:Reverse transcriptase domain-containing protein n=1 Tax=Elysia crispata TaxID=231223 RepID=A0AAE1DW05_9GAST|nr:hypothetical protein RRG08_039426 [Elysia crispata]
MEKQSVITKVEEPTAWVNPMILVQKPNRDIRICIDPQQLNKAPEVFQKIIHRHFGDLPGVVNYEDDMCVWSSTLEEHKVELRKILQRAQECELKFNKAKCDFAKPTLQYLGHILSPDGLKADGSKVSAIKNMPSPQKQKGSDEIFGYGNLSDKVYPKHVRSNWTSSRIAGERQ